MFNIKADRSIWTTLQKGDLGEALAQVAFLRLGCFIYTRKRDDHGVDFIAELPDGRLIKVQVKTATLSKSNPHIPVKKSKLAISDDMYIFVVLLTNDGEKQYLVPSVVFTDSPRGTLFNQWHNEGHRLEPEWQIKLGKKALILLEQYRVE
jgi:hypothetical protein